MHESKLSNNPEIIRWLQKRLKKTGTSHGVKKEYAMSKNQIAREEQVSRVFDQIDYNRSGTIEIDELNLMFAHYGIDISRHELTILFNLVDKDRTGDLNL